MRETKKARRAIVSARDMFRYRHSFTASSERIAAVLEAKSKEIVVNELRGMRDNRLEYVRQSERHAAHMLAQPIDPEKTHHVWPRLPDGRCRISDSEHRAFDLARIDAARAQMQKEADWYEALAAAVERGEIDA